MLLRLSVKMKVSMTSILVYYIASSKACNSAFRIFGQPRSLASILVANGASNTPEHAMFPFP